MWVSSYAATSAIFLGANLKRYRKMKITKAYRMILIYELLDEHDIILYIVCVFNC